MLLLLLLYHYYSCPQGELLLSITYWDRRLNQKGALLTEKVFTRKVVVAAYLNEEIKSITALH